MFVVLEPIDESESLTGELPGATAFDQPPLLIGSKVSLGGEPRWTVVEIDVYHHETEPLYIAHCAVDVQAIGDRHTWSKVRRGKAREISLAVFWSDQDLGMEWNFTGRSPQIGEILPEFDVATHQIYPQPWKVATVQEYKPLDLACYTAVFLAQCEAIELAAV
jgi:hypothetical protein